jgi:hypothetical protein
MNKMIAAVSVTLLVLLAGCASAPVPRGSDGTYQSMPAHPAAAPSAQSSSADRTQ